MSIYYPGGPFYTNVGAPGAADISTIISHVHCTPLSALLQGLKNNSVSRDVSRKIVVC